MGASPMLHPALWALLGLRARAGLRRWRRSVTTVGGSLAFLFGVLAIGAAAYPILSGRPPVITLEPERLGLLYQSALFAFVIVGQIKNLGDRAVYFTPGEADFLFPGPFGRRELLTYRILSDVGGAFVMSAMLSLLLAGVGAWWPAVLVGGMVSFVFLHQTALCLATVREILELQASSLLSRVLILAVGVLVVAVVMHALSLQPGRFAGEPLTAVAGGTSMERTSSLNFLLAPFLPFAEVVTARVFDAATLGWLLCCLLINAAVFVLLVRLDAGNLHTAEVMSRRDRHSSAATRRRAATPRRVRGSHALALLPHLRGLGTLAAVQLTTAMRRQRLLVQLTIIVGAIALALQFGSSGGGDGDGVTPMSLLSAVLWTTVLIANPLRLDFRGNLRTLEYLKTLPTPGWAICAGQLTAPVLVTLLYQLPFLLIAAGTLPPVQLLAAVCVGVPLTVIWYSLENITFLMYPAGQQSQALGDIQAIGRQVVILCVKLVILLAGAVLAIGLGVGVAKLVGLTAVGLVYVIGVALVIEALLSLVLLTRAFATFDVTRLAAAES